MDRKKPPEADSPARQLDAAMARHQQGDLAGAVTGYRRLLQRLPGNTDISHLLGLALWQTGEHEEGLRLVLAAAKAAPGSAAIQNNLGGMLMQDRQFAAAERAFRAALTANPKLVDAWSNLAAVLLEQNRPDAAEKAARQALAADPARADAWSNRGVALLELGRLDEAETCQRKALDLNPALAVAHANLGTLLRRRDDAAAVSAFRRALDLDADQPIARFNLSLDHLAQGRLQQGWTDYEERFRARQRQPRRNLDLPFWQGEMLEGRHLLIWPEQGLGDEILFASVFPDLAGLDGPVTVECEARLVPLFARSFAHLRVAAAGTTPAADLQIAAGSLPRLARPSLGRFSGAPWLTPDAARVEHWRRALVLDGPALTVGFCWRSGLKGGERTGLYPQLADFAPLFALPGIRWVALQYDLDDPATAAELAAGVPDGLDLFRPALDLRDDLDGVAALMAALDLVVSAATSVSELAGALGVPVWRVGTGDDWTRLGAGARPWYGTTRCFAPAPGRGFPGLLADMARELARLRTRTVVAGDAETLFRQGTALLGAGRAGEAVGLLEQAVMLRPGHAPGLSRLAGALRAAGRPADARARYGQALALQPGNPVPLVNTALCRIDEGDLDGAEADLAAVLAAHPGMAPAHDALGLVRQGRDDHAGAVAAHRAAVQADPRLLSGWVNLGAALRASHRFGEAVAALKRARDIDCDRVEVWAGLGYALYRTLDQAGAEAALQRALALVPDYPPALIDLARIRDLQGRGAEGLALLDRVLATDPGNILARFNRGHLLLANGLTQQGWADYRTRFAAGQSTPDRRFAIPAWRGEDVAGRRLLVWREQGLGDEILFAGLIGDLIRAGAGVIVECDPRLVGLIARSFPGIVARAETEDPRDGDFHCAMGDLAGLLRPAPSRFAAATAWMRPDPALAGTMADRLATLPAGLRVGFCWRSRNREGDRASSYLELADLLPLLTLPGIVPVSLQYDGAEAEIAALAHRTGARVHSFPDIDLTDDLESAAALIAGLDLVIGAATAVGEMAGALGVPVWRFQNGRDWSALGMAVRPWFPTMRLFTQAEAIDTVAPMVRVLSSPPHPADREPPALPAMVERHQAGDLAGAEAGYRAVLAAVPDDVDALHLLSQVLLQTGRGREALPFIDRALALDPDFAAAHNTRGGLLKGLGRFAEAEKAFRRALALRADFAEAWTNLGAALVELRRYAEAEKAHRRALAQRPGYPRALVNLGVALRHLGRYAEAAQSHRQALALAPGMADGWSDLGLCLGHMGDGAEAVRCQEQALSADPAYAEAAVNLAVLQAGQGRVAAARATLARALAIRPDFARALYNDGLLALSVGDLEAGWAGHEARFASGEVAWGHPPPVPRWDGGPLGGRRLLVWREQGLGDELMFAAHYGRLARLGGQVTLWAEPRLVPILARAFPFAVVLAEGSEVGVDCHVPAGSLPSLLAPALSGWDGAAFLAPRPDLAALWRDRLAGLPPGLRVGLCWRSQLRTAARDAGYTRLTDWLPLLRLAGIQVVSLQYDGAAAEIDALAAAHGVVLHRWDGVDLRDDLETALALTAGLDLVITVGTAVGEMAGALGVPVWRLSAGIDWTGLGADIRPWFASMRLFTAPPGQRAAGQIPAIVKALAGLMEDGAPAGDPDQWLERAIGRQKGGDPAGAIPLYRAILARIPEQPVALHLLGLALQQTGRAAAGEPFMERAVAAAPDYGAAWVNLGNLRQELERPGAAETAYRRALALRPDDAGAWTNLGNALRAQGRLEEAAKAHRRAIGFDRANPVPHANLATVCKEMDRPADAVAAYRHALALGGGEAGLRAGLGDALRMAGDGAGARAELEAALALDPQQAEAWNSLGRLAADPAMARGHYRRALAAEPGLATARYNLGLLDLADGTLAPGWDGYRARFQGTPSIRGRTLSLPLWRGEDLAGRRLLVWGEQGLGDQLMFATLYPALLERCGHLVIEGDARLVPLFTRAFPQATVRGPTADPRDADLAVAAGDVAGLSWQRPGDMAPAPYLCPRADLLTHWRERLAALGPGLKVGVCWRSARINAERSPSYFPLAGLASVAALPGVTLVSLQRGDWRGEWDAADFPLTRFDDLDLDDDLEGQAALISALDLVITAPSAVGELAGALGAPVWRLGPPDWTRLGTGARPWFPTMRLMDQGQGMTAALIDMARRLADLK
ncbi:tetratricopeptide repeat protein [Niveispirillum sp. KHB5.9]|uniref:tetratricopeptide repeat protein n=1 Tax=Niveispirillum sp. KHB5.9 TaxID=3400269 RepID=UPI003A8BDA66